MWVWCIHPWPAAVHFKSSQLVRSPHEHSSHFPVFASALWTVKLLYKSTCMNHFQTHFSFTQLRRKPTKGQHCLLSVLLPPPFCLCLIFSSRLLCLPPSLFSFSPLSASHFPLFPSMSHVCVPVLCALTVSVSHVSPQLWRTAGSSWWISLTTNCGCLCPMCHSPMRDAMCASSTQILLRKPSQTSLSWVGARVAHVNPSHVSRPVFTRTYTFIVSGSDGECEIIVIFDPVIFSNWNKMSAN